MQVHQRGRFKFLRTSPKPDVPKCTLQYYLLTGKRNKVLIDPDMAGMSDLSDQECKTTMINKLRALADKENGIQEHMTNLSREMVILRKNQKKTKY